MNQVLYSANGIDAYVAKQFPAGYLGTACEVGAYNGWDGSSCLHFEQLGWTVLCVEANPLHAESGRSHRRLWRQVAAAEADWDSRPLYRYGDGWSPSLTSLAPTSRLDGSLPSDRVMVPARRLDRLLDEAGFTRLDLLTVDVEGFEPEVMAGFTLSRWRPKVIVLESWKNDIATPAGYTLVERLQDDNIYVRNP